jgi:hypothetical protein
MEDAILKLLRAKLEDGVRERGRADFDRRIGRPGTGWTSKFLAGREGIPTLPSLLRILGELRIHPADFFAEALPRPSDGGTEIPADERPSDAVRALMARRMRALEERMALQEQRLEELAGEKAEGEGKG